MVEFSSSRFVNTFGQGTLMISTLVNEFSVSRSILVSSLQPINPKLSKTNYRYWRAQIISIVGSHGLEDHLIGLVPYPSPFVYVKNVESGGLIK